MKTVGRIGMIIGLALGAASPAMPQFAPSGGPTVTVGGGNETADVDRGRPLVLVASGLGVPSQVFREAFSHVTPAPGGHEPDPQQVQRNKQALLDALSKYGVTNDQLDKVSDYYRYRPGRGNLWKTKAAVVEAVVTNDVVTAFKIVDGGAGYSSQPVISVAGHPEIRATSIIAFSKDLSKNGSIAKIDIQRK